MNDIQQMPNDLRQLAHTSVDGIELVLERRFSYDIQGDLRKPLGRIYGCTIGGMSQLGLQFFSQLYTLVVNQGAQDRE